MRMSSYKTMTQSICAPLIAGTQPDRIALLQVQALELWRSHGFTPAEERFFVHVLESDQPFIKIPSKYRRYLIDAVTLFKELRDERHAQQVA